MTFCEALAVSVVYASLVILCGVTTYTLVRDELKRIDEEDLDE